MILDLIGFKLDIYGYDVMKKISAAEFMATHKQAGKNSKLEPYRDDILLLKKEGYTQQQIMDFLKLNGVSVGMTTLNWFIRSRADKTSVVTETRDRVIDNPVRAESRQAVVRPVQSGKQPKEQSESKKTKHPVIRKFNLNDQIDAQELM